MTECVTDIASEICGKEQNKKKQNWMNSDILDMMEERRKFKNTCTETGRAKYKELKHTIQKQCRLAKDNYYNEKCIELEELDRIHSQLVYKKIKEFQPRRNRILQHIKDKQGKSLQERGEILERWAEYVEDLYKDKERGEANRGEITKEVYSISVKEINEIIKDLPKEKAYGDDHIPAELLQCLGEEGIEIISKLINKIYNSGCIPQDFCKSIFIPLPIIAKAQDCSDFRTITLISHASKILLKLIKKRITPIVENHLSESQMGFRKGKGTRDAIFQLRMTCERSMEVNKNIYLCFIDYQKAFDRVRHDKLVEIMEKAGIPELERRLIINLYWEQQAMLRWENDTTRTFEIRRGVRQGCILSPILFNLYSEFMIAEALDDLKGVQFNGINITNFRYADDAVLAAYSKQKLQVMLDKLSETCNNYGMAINVKKTKVMIVSKRGKIKCQVTLDNKTLEQVSRYKYLGSWISDDAKCVEEIRTRIALAKEAFWKNKELLRGNIRPRTKLKILNCYVFSVLNYGCEC